MKRLSRVLLFMTTILTSSLTLAEEISVGLKQRIADILTDVSTRQEIILTEDQILEIEVDNIKIDVDTSLLQELEKQGLIDNATVAKTGGRTIRP